MGQGWVGPGWGGLKFGLRWPTVTSRESLTESLQSLYTITDRKKSNIELRYGGYQGGIHLD